LLRELWRIWKAFAQAVGNFQARIILSLFYLLIAAPFGLALRFFSDPLRIKPRALPSFWLPREPKDLNFEDTRRQF
jgi:hypothetical protein